MRKLGRQEFLYGIAGVLLGILIVGVLVVLTGTWSMTNRLRDAQLNNTEILRVIKDCTTVGGKCQQRNQKAMEHATSDINRVSIYAAACASKRDNRGSVVKIQTCVLNRIQEDANNEELSTERD